MLGYLSTDIICSEKRTVYREGSSRKTAVSFEEQVMSADKYASIFSCQMEAIVFFILQILFAARVVLKIGEYLVNKPLLAPGMSADDVRGWDIVRKMNIWPRSEASRANVKFGRQSQPKTLSANIPASQKGVYLFYNAPINCLHILLILLYLWEQHWRPVFFNVIIDGFHEKSLFFFYEK